MDLPKKEIDFSINDNEYGAKYPNNGQFIDIQAMKARLTGDSYNTIADGNTTSSQLARYTVDMISFFNVCCPKLKLDLKLNSFSELEMIDSKKLLKVYVSIILPWLTEWENILNSDDSVETVKE